MTRIQTKNKTIIDLPVREVILMEDRARIKRQGKIHLIKGQSTVHIKKVSLILADKTIQGHLIKPDNGSEVVSVKMNRQHNELKNIGDADIMKLNRSLSDLQLNAQRLSEKHIKLNNDQNLLSQLEERALIEMATDASWGKSDQQLWEKDLISIRSEIEKLTFLRKDNVEKRQKLQDEIEKLSQQRSTAQCVTEEFSGSLEIVVNMISEGEADLEIEYIVPAACWRPCHTALLKNTAEGYQFEIEAEACVWQVTGEHWNDVKLYFSTQRPSLGTEPPELNEDRLAVQKKPEQVIVETREQVIQTAGMGQTEIKTEMPGIDDGGETLNLQAETLSNVPSDGLPYRIRMYRMTCNAKADLICMPEVSETAVLQSEQTNTTDSPLLAGPVDLIRDNGRVGRTTLSFVAPGEKFKLGWGPDPEIRVHRWHREDQLSSKKLSSWEENRKKTQIRLSNIGASVKEVLLSERIPVSEIEQVEVIFHPEQTTDNPGPNENGIINWPIKLEAYDRNIVNLEYTIRKKKSVEGI